MNNIDWVKVIVAVLSGVAVIIPLVVELVKYVKLAVREKNWSNMLRLVMNLMAEAEDMFEHGADKKAWVLNEMKAVAATLNYDIDWEVVSEMIDALCDMAKEVN